MAFNMQNAFFPQFYEQFLTDPPNNLNDGFYISINQKHEVIPTQHK